MDVKLIRLRNICRRRLKLCNIRAMAKLSLKVAADDAAVGDEISIFFDQFWGTLLEDNGLEG